MQKRIISLLFLLSLISCKEISESPSMVKEKTQISMINHATGLAIDDIKDGKMITINNAWPDSDEVFKYAVVKKGVILENPEQYDAILETPVRSIVVTSTTHIPSLDLLGVSDYLVGFPNLDYISSKTIRERIKEGSITELGKNEDINTEVLIDLDPDLVIGFAVDGSNKTLNTIRNIGIPVLYNGDWTENTPLGKAEWIKFFGVIFEKENKADSIFSEIEGEYLKAKEIAKKSSYIPTIMSGAMYKDIWYLPYGDSWAAQFIKDANGNYLWSDSKGSGSLVLNLENVLDKGKNADIWIGPGYFSKMKQLEDAHPLYSQFDSFKNGQIYSFANKKGETGGVLYYELAPNRPDIVLKDLIKILHPDLLPDHQLYFFGKLK